MPGRYDPFGELMQEVLKGTFARSVSSAGAEPVLRVRVDVYERNGDYVVLADLPGVKKEDIQVQVVGEEVSISAEARKEPTGEGERAVHSERTSGKFARSFRLPEEIDNERVAAKFAHGVLELTLPKRAPAASRKITIQ